MSRSDPLSTKRKAAKKPARPAVQQDAEHDARFALGQMSKATEIGVEWNEGKRTAFLWDVMAGMWANTSALFLIAYQIAQYRAEHSQPQISDAGNPVDKSQAENTANSQTKKA